MVMIMCCHDTHSTWDHNGVQLKVISIMEERIIKKNQRMIAGSLNFLKNIDLILIILELNSV